jgi:acetyltransferase-like isoleucine patch superfamily enzyme
VIRVRLYLTLLLGLTPPSSVKNRLLSVLNKGWAIHPEAKIHPVLLLRVGVLHAGTASKIGFGTVVRDLDAVTLDPSATIGQWNWITAARPLSRLTARGCFLHMERHSALTSRHYVDCSGGITIGEFATVAGVRSSLLTHGIDLGRSEQDVSGLVIGPFSLVSSNVKMTPGSRVPARSLVAMGSVVASGLSEPQCLYAGVPAVAKKKLPDCAYFHRTVGSVRPGHTHSSTESVLR